MKGGVLGLASQEVEPLGIKTSTRKENSFVDKEVGINRSDGWVCWGGTCGGTRD